MFLGANSSRPTGSFRQRPKTYKARKVGISDASRQRKQTKLLTDVDHYLTLREPCVASLRSDRHEIGMTDRHHRNAQAKWHAQIGDPTVADSILDRLVHGAHRIELQGESMRKKKGSRGGKDTE